jgi:hypothetical protein
MTDPSYHNVQLVILGGGGCELFDKSHPFMLRTDAPFFTAVCEAPLIHPPATTPHA